MDQAEIETRFTYHEPKDGQAGDYHDLRERGKDLAFLIDNLCPESREKSLAITNLEQAVFWANAAIARRS